MCSVVTNIYGKVVEILIEIAEYSQVVYCRLFGWCYGVFADVATENYTLVSLAHIFDYRLEALRCQAYAIEYSVIFG